MTDTMTITIPGVRYQAQAPDTLDLSARAALALHGLGGSIDPELLTMYGLICYACARPVMSHWASAETLVDPKFAESFTLMRLMSGSSEHAELEAAYRRALLSRIDDGLYWDRHDPRRPWRNFYAPDYYGEGRAEDFCTLPGTGRMLRTLLIWREQGEGACEPLARALTAGLRRILVEKGDYGYYPEKGGWGEPCSYPRSGWLNTDEAQSDTEGGEGAVTAMHGHQLYAAAKWYAQSGDPTALELSTKLARYCLLPRFWGGVPDPHGDRTGLPGHICACASDPPFTAGHELGHWYSHFHARAITLRGLLEYGWATGDLRTLEFVRRSYEFSLTQGIARLGWINCWPGAMNLMEGCALGDLAALGIRLADIGLGDYWDDVDALVRNHLVEGQLTRADVLERIVAASAGQKSWVEYDDLPGKYCYDDIIQRTLGVFAGKSLPDSIPTPWVMHCCTSNATQGLYYAWEGTVREEGDSAQVNLLLNRAATLLDVDSHLPYDGRVCLRNKGARRISVRIPAWVDRRALRVQVGQADRPLEWVGNYVVIADLRPGDVVTLTFPVPETTARYTVNAHTDAEQVYTCTFRGSTLVDLSPRDDAPTSYPLYQRVHLRHAGPAPVTTVERFVPERTVRGW